MKNFHQSSYEITKWLKLFTRKQMQLHFYANIYIENTCPEHAPTCVDVFICLGIYDTIVILRLIE